MSAGSHVSESVADTLPCTDRAKILWEHYRDHVKALGEHLSYRDKLFVAVFAVLLLMLWQAYDPTGFAALSTAWASNYLKSQGAAYGVPQLFLASVLWFLFSTLSIQTFSTLIRIAEEARYVRNCERELRSELGRDYIRRYISKLTDQPVFFRQVNDSFQMIFVTFVCLAIGYRMYSEWLRDPPQTTEAWCFRALNLVFVGAIGWFAALFVRWHGENRRKVSVERAYWSEETSEGTPTGHG
jgi:hypothetical protein